MMSCIDEILNKIKKKDWINKIDRDGNTLHVIFNGEKTTKDDAMLDVYEILLEYPECDVEIIISRW